MRAKPVPPPLSPPLAVDDRELIPRPLAVLILFLPLLLLFQARPLRSVFEDTRTPDWRANVPAPEMSEETSATMRLVGGWRRVAGERLSPDTTGGTQAVEFDVPPGNWDHAEIEVVGAPESRWVVRISRGNSAVSFPRVLSEERFVVEEDSLPGESTADPIRVRLIPQDPGRSTEDGGRRFALLRRVDARFAVLRSNRLPDVPAIIGLGMLPFFAGVFLRVYRGWQARRAAIAAVGLGAVGIAGALYRPIEGQVLWSTAVGLGFGTSLMASLRAQGIQLGRGAGRFPIEAEELRRGVPAVLGPALVLAALMPRWQIFLEARRSILDPDARGFLEIARSGQGVYETAQSFAPWVREPLIVWLLKLWFLIAPNTDSSGRIGSMVVSLAMIGGIYLVGRRVVGEFPAVVAALGIGFIPEWARMGSRILRLDLSLLILMGMIGARELLKDRRWWRAAAMGALGGAWILTRISGLTFALPVLAWEAWRGKWKPGEIALALALAIVPLLPHLAFNYRYEDSRDPFLTSTVHTRYYLNSEQVGKPGGMSAAEFRVDPYRGGRVTTGAFFFKYHTVAEVAARHVWGYWNMFVWKYPREMLFFGHEWLMLPCVLGLWGLWRRRLVWLCVWFGLAAFPYAFIAAGSWSWRLGGFVHVVVLWTWGIGLVTLWESGLARWRAWRGAGVGGPQS